MNAVRMNITLPEELAKKLDELAGHKKKSQFIAEALRQKMEQLQNAQLQLLLEEGYKFNRQESISMAREFEAIDLEGWNDY